MNSKFTLLVNQELIAHQIASLLNMYNALTTIHTSSTILNSSINYIVEHSVVRNKLEVVGCVGISPTGLDTTLIKHLCVKQETRNKGIAMKLVRTAINSITTNYVHMSIRSNNYPSLSLAEKLGFLVISQQAKQGYNIVNVGRAVNDDE